MPLYEYECTQCKRHTEKIQKFSDPEITACPYCGGLLQRVLSAPAIAFKGGGWFKDGYGNARPTSNSEGKGDSNNSSVDSTSAPSKDAAPSATSAPVPAASPAQSSSDNK